MTLSRCQELERVVENLASSLQEAETVIQLAITTVASVEGLTETAQVELKEKLSNARANVEGELCTHVASSFCSGTNTLSRLRIHHW